jgi:hypothetical protein
LEHKGYFFIPQTPRHNASNEEKHASFLFAAGNTIWLNECLVYLAKAIIFFASSKPAALA